MPNEVEQFDVRQATAIVQPYNGSVEGLDTFIDSAMLLKDLTPESKTLMAVRFLKTRLSGKARSGLPETITTIDGIINHIKNKCKDTTTPDSIITKLNSTRQRGQIASFCEDIENLCMKLENSYIVQKVPEDVAKNMTTKAGVNALINGISTSETKLILKAGNFSSIKEALQKAQEYSSDIPNSSQIFNMQNKRNNVRHNTYNRNNSRGNGFNRNQNFTNYSRRGYASGNQTNSHYQPHRGRYQRGSYNNRGRYNNIRPRFEGGNRMYIANVDQSVDIPQNQNREIQSGVPNRIASQQNQEQQRIFLDQY